ncbi:hypothetical protein F4810DRAFT_584758 [Camillea tinctor]|nr:hypothetical protein F4810DRAFT_584758 [Camillea tinctor]
MERMAGTEAVDSKPKLFMPEYAGREIAKIAADSLLPCEAAVSMESGHRQLGSYSWLGSNSDYTKRMIYVPGAPPIYIPKEKHERIVLRRFSAGHRKGFQFVEGLKSLVPSFQAIERLNPNYTFNHIDIIIFSAAMTDFFTFCQGEIHQKRVALDVSLIKDTLAISRTPARWDLWFEEARRGTFGLAFQRGLTKWPKGLENSSSHVRILEYKFGDLNLAVICGVDASIRWPEEGSRTVIYNRSNELDVSGSAQVVPCGFTCREPAVELKLFRPGPDFSNFILRQTWMTRTAYAALGRLQEQHKITSTVELEDVMIYKLDQWQLDWERDNQVVLRKMARLFSRLRELVRNTGRQRAYITRQARAQNTPLQVHHSACDIPLEEAHIKKFWK